MLSVREEEALCSRPPLGRFWMMFYDVELKATTARNVHVSMTTDVPSSEQQRTFGGLEEADAGLDLGPVLVLLLWGVFHHQLVELHRDDVVVIWKMHHKHTEMLQHPAAALGSVKTPSC